MASHAGTGLIGDPCRQLQAVAPNCLRREQRMVDAPEAHSNHQNNPHLQLNRNICQRFTGVDRHSPTPGAFYHNKICLAQHHAPTQANKAAGLQGLACKVCRYVGRDCGLKGDRIDLTVV